MDSPVQRTLAFVHPARTGRSAWVLHAMIAVCFMAIVAVPTHAQSDAPDVSYRVTANGIIYTVMERETLSGIAQRFTGKLTDWRIIGRTNGIENDRTIPIGKQIVIPARLLAPKSAFARIEAFFGSIRIHGNDGNGIEARVGALLKEGDTLATLANSFISLVLDDGTRFMLPPDSVLNLKLLRATNFIDQPRTRLYLERGRVESYVTPLKSPGATYEVISPTAVSGVRGTRFRVNAEAKRSMSEVLDGKVAVSGAAGTGAQGSSRLVPKGYGTVVENGRVSNPVSLLAVPSLNDAFALQQRLPLQFALSGEAAHAFRITISTDDAGLNNIAEVVVPTANGQAVAKLDTLEDGDYFVRYSAVDEHGLQGLQNILPFRVKARPFPPFLLEPGAKFQGSGSGDAVSVTMQWSEVASATGYRLQISKDAEFGHPAIDRVIDRAAAQGVQLQPGKYYWRLASIATKPDGATDQGPFGDAKKVEILTGQAAPAVHQQDGETRFTWTAAPGQRFTFQIAASDSFDVLLENLETLEPAASVRGLPSGTYYARVRSTDADGFVGAFSPPQKFSIPVLWRTGYGGTLQSQGSSVDTGY
jgi:hypothetical protein